MVVMMKEHDPILKDKNQMRKEANLINELGSMLIADTSKNPEKLNASFERVEEVLDMVLDQKNFKRAVKILEKGCWDNGNVVQEKMD